MTSYIDLTQVRHYSDLCDDTFSPNFNGPISASGEKVKDNAKALIPTPFISCVYFADAGFYCGIYASVFQTWYKSHETVDHGIGEYANGDIHVNTAESWFALLKRGVYGTFHHVSDKHLDRYLAEFMFRWDNRKASDFERTMRTIEASKGKRLYYKKPIGKSEH